MDALIHIESDKVGGDIRQTVNARELHAFLENKDHFSTWIKQRIDQFAFVENQDYASFSGFTEKGGRPRMDYHLTIDMAKELSMVERNSKGKQARQYFIECERRTWAAPVCVAPAFAVPTTLSGALRLAAEQAETIEAQSRQIAVAQPAVEFVGRYVESTGAKGFRQVCKLLAANESDFRDFLQDKKIMYRLNGEWAPYADHLDAGRFEVRAGVAEVSRHAFNQAKFTPKGVTWIAGEWAKHRVRGMDGVAM